MQCQERPGEGLGVKQRAVGAELTQPSIQWHGVSTELCRSPRPLWLQQGWMAPRGAALFIQRDVIYPGASWDPGSFLPVIRLEAATLQLLST